MDSDATALDSLLEKVHLDGGHDFRNYKRGTVIRRLERRLFVTGARTYLDYMQFLDAHPEEYELLADYLTIKVSGFFRSAYTFLQLAGLVLSELVSCKRDQRQPSLRFWSTACARGEEPYSIAILLTGLLGKNLRYSNISIHATDISRQALHEAQAGLYSPQEVESLPPYILATYFTRQDGGYTVNSDIKQMVNFSYFDLTSTKTSPFTNLNCIFCCNVLIYLQKQLQERVLGMLYDSLATPGYLILGEAETPTSSLNGKLECLNTKAKIYKRKRSGLLKQDNSPVLFRR